MTVRSIAMAATLLVPSAGVANAGETHEFWPELQFHKWFNDRQSRAILMMSHSRDRDSMRERIQVQRDITIGNYLFTPYASAEVYFDTQYKQMSRYRLILGVTLPVCEHFSVEPYLARQVDNAGSFTITNAIGLTVIASF